MAKKTKGQRPKNLTGQMPVSPLNSPWWDNAVYAFVTNSDHVGKTMTIEQITVLVSQYPGGRMPYGRTVARRLKHVLELVSRGPNGSLGKGATYKVIGLKPAEASGRRDTIDEEIPVANDWLLERIASMTEE